MSLKNEKDDYYASIHTTETNNTSGQAKKPLIVKKKIKVKPKQEEVSKKVPDTAVEQQNTSDTQEEKISKTKEFISPISFHEKKDVPDDTHQDNEISEKTEEKPAVKFKAGGFGKWVKPLIKKKEQDGEWKKSKYQSYNKNQRHKKVSIDDENSGFVRSGKIKHKKKQEKNIEDMKQNLTVRTGETVILSDAVSLKEFSEKIGVPIVKLIAEFMKNGMAVNINSQIDFDTATLISDVFEVNLQKDTSEGVGVDDLVKWDIRDFLKEDDSSVLEKRAPVVSIMGHVDHGKTSLLDYIRSSKIASGEAGGITQSIGAYQAEHDGKHITFLDTPGHEAFSVMRARGAKSTDIAILVVASDEGVKPQTIESISHAKEAGIPVIVAINKMDKESANPDFVKGQLAENGLTPEDWGWETPMVPVSAHTGFGIDDLLEIILLTAEMLELKANPQRSAVATILESHLDTQLGPVATILINTGTLNNGDTIVCADAYGKIKVLKDFSWKNIRFAIPGTPALVVGLDRVVEGGDILQTVSTPEAAKQKAIQYREVKNHKKQIGSSQLDMLMHRIKSGSLQQLKIVVKADTNGSLEAIKNALLKLSTEETIVTLIHTGVGNITEGDVLMCQWSDALLVAFWVEVVPTARRSLEEAKIEFIQSKIIYHISERIEKIVSGMLDPKEVEIILWQAIVGGIFYTSKEFSVIGLILKEGNNIEDKALVRVIRGDKIVGKWSIKSLKQGVEEMKKVEWPTECGIKFKGDMVPEMKDVLEIYKITIEK